MTLFNGVSALIKVSDNGLGGASANWVSIAQQKGGSDTLNTETVDGSNKDTAGWAKVFITKTGWSVSVDGMLDVADPVLTYIRGRILARSTIWVQIDQSTLGGTKEEGQAACSMTRDYPEGDTVKFTLEFTGDGSLITSP